MTRFIIFVKNIALTDLFITANHNLKPKSVYKIREVVIYCILMVLRLVFNICGIIKRFHY